MTQTWPTPIQFGPWLLDARLGVGGTSEVWRARHVTMPGEFAVKRLLPMCCDDAVAVGRFHREIAALQRMSGPRLPQLVGHGEVAGVPWLAMPCYTGVTLRRLLTAGPLPAPVALEIVAELADTLATVHAAGWVHCDVSPDNVQVTAAGEIVLLDLGIAQEVHAPPPIDGRSVPGRAAYLSPEQIARRPLDGRSDLFAVGSLLVELLKGRPPFLRGDRDATLRAVQAGVWNVPAEAPEATQRLLHDLLAPEPNQRVPTAGELVRRLALSPDRAVDLRPELMARVAALPDRTPEPPWQAAEWRGEAVTDPALDDGATVART